MLNGHYATQHKTEYSVTEAVAIRKDPRAWRHLKSRDAQNGSLEHKSVEYERKYFQNTLVVEHYQRKYADCQSGEKPDYDEVKVIAQNSGECSWWRCQGWHDIRSTYIMLFSLFLHGADAQVTCCVKK